jgi:hypothetical protein
MKKNTSKRKSIRKIRRSRRSRRSTMGKDAIKVNKYNNYEEIFNTILRKERKMDDEILAKVKSFDYKDDIDKMLNDLVLECIYNSENENDCINNFNQYNQIKGLFLDIKSHNIEYPNQYILASLNIREEAKSKRIYRLYKLSEELYKGYISNLELKQKIFNIIKETDKMEILLNIEKFDYLYKQLLHKDVIDIYNSIIYNSNQKTKQYLIDAYN